MKDGLPNKNLSNILFLIVLMVIFLATSWSLFKPGLFHTHDTSHAARIVEMTRALDDGHWPVRWVENFGLGYGMPLFEFYAPLPYYVGSLFYGLGLDILLSIKVIYVLCSLLTVAGSYLLGKELTGFKFSALLTCTAISLAPYRAVDLFVRGAISEAWGIMALPWILWGVLLIFHHRRLGWLVFSLSLTGLFLSHNLTTLIFFPVLWTLIGGFIVIDESKLKAKITILIKFVGASFLALSLSAFYLLPALGEQHLTHVYGQAISSFQYADYFVFARQLVTPLWGYGGAAPGPYNDQSNFLGYGQLIGLVVAIGLVITYVLVRRKTNRTVKQILLLLTLFVATIFMLHGRSMWLWQNFQLLQILQFPWRWLSVAVVLLGTISGLGSTLIKHAVIRSLYCLGLSLIIIVGNFKYFRPQDYLLNPEQYYFTNPAVIRSQNGPGFADYLPIRVTNLQPTNYVATASGEIHSIKVILAKVQRKVITTNFVQPQVVYFGVADFPGWQVKLDHQIVQKRADSNGRIAVQVPAGQHRVEVGFTSTPLRRGSDLLSAASWLAFLCVCAKLAICQTQHQKKMPNELWNCLRTWIRPT